MDQATMSYAQLLEAYEALQARVRALEGAEALRESEERFRMLADNISQLAWTCDLLGNVTWYNKRWLDYTGLTFEDMKGWGWTKVQHPDHVDRVVARVQRAGETGEPWEDTFPLRGRDGQYRWFLSRALPIRDEQGNLVQWFGTNTDITEQKLAEEQVARQAQELQALNERLQELDRLKNEFFSNVSHEFRTPLTLMLGPVEDILAKPEGQVLPENRELLTLVQRNGLRLQRLVNTLLDFSRLEAGRVEASYEPTDLATLTADFASTFRSACERAGLRLVVDCPALPAPVYVDRDMWEKLVLNLLSNAVKFTFVGEIAVILRPAGEAVELAVRDTGIGIPAAEIPYLFERFHRVAGAHGRTHEGTGIGLALVQDLVQLHGGSVRVESAPGRGSTFFVSIPMGTAHLPADRIGSTRTLASTALGASPYVEEALRWRPEAASPALPTSGLATGLEDLIPPPSAAVLPLPAGASASGRRARILWADDNADMRDYVRRLLSARYDVEAVADGEAALAVVRARRPDLVLADVMMPRLDGFGVLRALRADPELQTLPVILLSARAGEEARIEGLEASADAYLVKPFSARELLAYVEAHLELGRLRARVEQVVRESAARQRAILSQALFGVAVMDLTGHFVEVNQAYCDLTGYTAQELLATDFPSITHPEDRDANLALIRQLLAGQLPGFVTEQRYVRKDGGHVWVRHAVSLIRDGGGQPAQIVALADDLTERKRAEDALRASEERFRRLVALLPAAVYTCDAPSGSITFYNDQAATLWGRAPRLGDTDARFCGSFKLWWPDGTSLPHEEAPMAVAVREGRAVRNQEVVIERPDGTRVTVLVNIDPVRADDGLLVGAINVFHDTTALKQAEQALRDSERRFREMIDALPAAIYTTDAAGRLTHFNPAAVEFSGRVPELGTDQWCVSWKLYYPDGTPMPHEACPMAITLKEGRAVRGVEAIVERPDGTRLWFAPYPTPLRDRAGRIVGGINMLMDITERKQAEAALRESQDHITRLNAQLRADLASMTRLQQVSTRLVQTGDFASLLDEVLDAAIAITGADMGNIQLLDGDTLKIVAQRGFDAPFLAFFNTVHDGLAACGTAMQRGERVIVDDVAASPLFVGSPAYDVMLAAQARAVQSTPLLTRSGRLLGMFSTHYRTPHRPAERELRLLDLLARQAADFIERVQAEAVREQLAAIVDASDDAIIGQTLEGVITSWNHGAERLYGYTTAEAIGQPIGLLVPPDMPDELSQILARLQRGERIDHHETQRVRKDGTRLDVALTISPIRDSTGRVIGASKIARDITARKQAEAMLQQAYAALEQRVQERTALLTLIQNVTRAANEAPTSAAALQYAVDCLCAYTGWPIGHVYLAVALGADRWAPTALWHLDAPEQFAVFQQATQTVEVAAGEGLIGRVSACGQPEWLCDVATDPTFQRRQAAQAAGLTTGVACPILVGPEVVGVLEFYATEALAPNPDLLEAMTQIGIQLGRVIERERAAEQLQRQQEALLQREKLAAMSTMLASVAHELNNPLASIVLQAELLHEDLRDGPLAEPVTEITQAAARCERLVRQFLTLARQHPPERAQAALNTLVAETVELLAYPFRVDNVAVHLHLDEQLPPLWGDPHQLQQVLINLLTNAQQALRAAPGTREVTLTTQYNPAQHRITLAVADSGPGIPVALQGRIFEPFFTTKPPGLGTGLGLSLCRGIIEDHGGILSVISPPGQGATFRIELPVGAVPANPPAPPGGDDGPAVRGKTILIVEDELSLATGLARLLQRDGQTVDTAANGRLALAKLEECAYDLILSDVRMPELDGPSLYRLLERQQPHLCQRIIFLTGDTLEPATREFLAQSGVPCLTKPFTAAAARRTIQRALRVGCTQGRV